MILLCYGLLRTCWQHFICVLSSLTLHWQQQDCWNLPECLSVSWHCTDSGLLHPYWGHYHYPITQILGDTLFLGGRVGTRTLPKFNNRLALGQFWFRKSISKGNSISAPFYYCLNMYFIYQYISSSSSPSSPSTSSTPKKPSATSISPNLQME